MIERSFFWGSLLLVLFGLFEPGRAELSPQAMAFRERLQESEGVEEFQKMESWIFEMDLGVAGVIERLEEGMEVISATPSRSRHRTEREPLMGRLLEEFADSWEAWMMAASIQNKLPDEVRVRDDGFERVLNNERGTHNVARRDRIRVLQLMMQAKELAERGHQEETVSGDELAQVYLEFADQFERLRTDGSKVLTDLILLPEPDSEQQWYQDRGPVLDASGKLLLPELRKSFEKAKTDDERIYWLRHQAGVVADRLKAQAKYDLAVFWHDLLGVDQLDEAGYLYLGGTESEFNLNAPGEFELHTLTDEESLVVGPDGPRRVSLPGHCQFIRMLNEVIKDQTASEELRWWTASLLAENIYVDRRQFEKALNLAAQMGTRKVEKYGKEVDERIEPWGLRRKVRLGGGGSVGHGFSPKVLVGSRGLDEVALEIRKVNIGKLLGRSDENVESDFLLGSDSRSYDAENDELKEVQKWLEDCSDHHQTLRVPIRQKGNWMQTITRVDTPGLEPGHYVVLFESEKELQVLPVQIYDVALVGVEMIKREESDHTSLMYAVDPLSGAPLEGVEFRQIKSESRDDFYTRSDHAGQLYGIPSERLSLVRRAGSEWQVIRWDRPDEIPELWGGNEVQSFLVTNQPLYRPGQQVSLAGWLRLAPEWMGWKRELPEKLPVRIRVYDPTGREVWTRHTRLDDFKGFTGEFQLGDEIVLGEYRVEIDMQDLDDDSLIWNTDPFAAESERKFVDFDEVNWDRVGVYRNWSFEVGEFRKPDFQVKLEPVVDGDGFEVIVEASYLSGEPVKGASVVVGLEATPFSPQFFPKRSWDDLYDEGYEWGASVPRHVAGWQTWGMWSWYVDLISGEYDDIVPWNYPIISKAKGVTGDNGRVRVKFDAEVPTQDRYSYQMRLLASVTEFSGRPVTTGESLRYTGRPFEVFARPLKGFYRSGEQVGVEVGILSVDRDPLPGKGTFKLERVVDGELEPVMSREIEVGETGIEMVRFEAPSGGQYRCVFEGGGSERGFVMEVVGEGRMSGSYGGVQVIPRDFITSPDGTVEVLIRTDEPSTKVWLFEGQPNGSGSSPRIVTTENQTAIVRLPVSRAAQPNFGVEALAFWKGKLKSNLCLILVPDAASRLDVAMTLDRKSGEPGGQAAVEVQVSDHEGAPAVSSMALTVFDRSLEDLSGGLPSTSRLREMFYLESRKTSSLGSRWDREWGFYGLREPGVFSDRYDLIGGATRDKASRFVKHGEDLWEGYEPPELPNQVGAGFGGGGAGFPMTPATPQFYPQMAERLPVGAKGDGRIEAVKVRKKFADRAYWGGALRTGKDGRLKVDFDLPENLTSWRVQSWAFGKGRSFGGAKLELPVSKELQVRPLIPRAAVVGDELVIGAMIQNLSKSRKDFVLTLETESATITDQGGRRIQLEAGAEGVARWRVALTGSGAAVFRVKAASADGKLTDGFEYRVPVAAREVSRTVSDSAVIRKNEKVSELRIPYDPGMAGREVQIRAEAHPAVSALTVLPDLVQYPYGCAEQTLNRFLPLLVASEAANQLGLDWEKMIHLSKNHGQSPGWISGRGQAGLSREPVDLSEAKVNDMVHVGISRLKELQNNDGSWGWFSGEDPKARVYLTALAVRGLTMAARVGRKLEKDHPTERAVWWLESWSNQDYSEKSSRDLLAKAAFAAWALKEAGSGEVAKLVDKLWVIRGILPLTSRIHLALAMEDDDKVKALTEEIRKEIAVLNVNRSHYFNWWSEPLERRGCFLKLLVKTGADESDLRDEIGTLLAARRDGIRWKSTRESGFCLEAIVEALLAAGADPFGGQLPTEIDIKMKGGNQMITLLKEELWSGKIALPVEEITDVGEGEIVLEITRRGDLESSVFLNASITHPSSDPKAMMEEEAGLRLERQYFRVNPEGSRKLLKAGDTLKVGEIIEVELRIDSDAPREFLHLRDPIPAGLEPLIQLSGYHQSAYRESRTGESHFFISELSDWSKTHRYRMSVVTGGSCVALPAQVECMYSPEIRGRSGVKEWSVER